MRVGSLQMTNRYMKQLNRTYERQTKLMEQSDGSRLHRGSDDSVAYSRLMRYKKDYDENLQYQDNIKSAISYMKNSAAALVNVSDCTKTMVEKVNAAQGTNTDKDMQAISEEMLVLVQESVSALNTQVGGKYLFSGQAVLTQPFRISDEKQNRVVFTMLDDMQMRSFESNSKTAPQLVTVTSGTDTYFWDTSNGKIWDADLENSRQMKLDPGQNKTLAELGINADGTVSSANPPMTVVFDDGTTQDFTIDTVSQYIVSYYGDTKNYSVPKQNGAVDPATDTANASGLDIMGANVFDNMASGANIASCVAALNDMLAIVAKADQGESCAPWMAGVGKTIANNAFDTFNTANTRLAARQQAYDSSLAMVQTQEENILDDITNASSTDVAKLAVNMMELQTTYQLSLSVGSRILPPTLADYL